MVLMWRTTPGACLPTFTPRQREMHYRSRSRTRGTVEQPKLRHALSPFSQQAHVPPRPQAGQVGSAHFGAGSPGLAIVRCRRRFCADTGARRAVYSQPSVRHAAPKPQSWHEHLRARRVQVAACSCDGRGLRRRVREAEVFAWELQPQCASLSEDPIQV